MSTDLYNQSGDELPPPSDEATIASEAAWGMLDAQASLQPVPQIPTWNAGEVRINALVPGGEVPQRYVDFGHEAVKKFLDDQRH